MKKNILYLSVFVFTLFTHSLECLSWGTTGHRVIAEIAEQSLNRKARKNVKDLLDDQYMAYWANWADFIKSDTTGRWDNTHIWHFVNAPKGLSKIEYIAHIKGQKQENIYSAILELKEILKDKKKSKAERKEALIFLIHLIGDMHQPMHVGRAEDRGGNMIKIIWFGQDTYLHALWDSKLVDHEKYNYTEYAKILNVITKEQKKEIQKGTIEDWLYDSNQIAEELYSMTNAGDELSFNYFYKVSPILNGQLQKAGFRLAQFLNDIF